MKNYLLYANGSFDNKGCEAIVRGVCKILNNNNDITMCSFIPELDKSVSEELNIELVKIPRTKESILNIFSAILIKIGIKKIGISVPFPKLKKIGKEYNYSFSLGGDNYCYPGNERFFRMNNNIRNNKSINIFWGCSIEEYFLNKQMIRDLEKYDYIFARERITFDLLSKKGFKNVLKCTDPAFTMGVKECLYDSMNSEYVGVNISPLTMSYSNSPDAMFKNIISMIKYILSTTHYKILLIPHVYGKGNDYDIHCKIRKEINDERIIVLKEQYDAMELKYIIGKSVAFVGARTHATIAAYSMKVPTLVLGYSVKASGIAQDLFGTDNGYVIKVQKEMSCERFLGEIKQFFENLESIRNILKQRIPEYLKNAYSILDVIGEKNEKR